MGSVRALCRGAGAVMGPHPSAAVCLLCVFRAHCWAGLCVGLCARRVPARQCSCEQDLGDSDPSTCSVSPC